MRPLKLQPHIPPYRIAADCKPTQGPAHFDVTTRQCEGAYSLAGV